MARSMVLIPVSVYSSYRLQVIRWSEIGVPAVLSQTPAFIRYWIAPGQPESTKATGVNN